MRAARLAGAAVLAGVLAGGCLKSAALADWRGRDEAWLFWKVGAPTADTRVGRLPARGATNSLAVEALQPLAPNYTGEVRHLRWTTLTADYHAYLIHTGQTWRVLHAFRETSRR